MVFGEVAMRLLMGVRGPFKIEMFMKRIANAITFSGNIISMANGHLVPQIEPTEIGWFDVG